MTVTNKLHKLSQIDAAALTEAMDALGWRGINPANPLDVIEQRLDELGEDAAWIESELDWLLANA